MYLAKLLYFSKHVPCQTNLYLCQNMYLTKLTCTFAKKTCQLSHSSRTTNSTCQSQWKKQEVVLSNRYVPCQNNLYLAKLTCTFQNMFLVELTCTFAKTCTLPNRYVPFQIGMYLFQISMYLFQIGMYLFPNNLYLAKITCTLLKQPIPCQTNLYQTKPVLSICTMNLWSN